MAFLKESNSNFLQEMELVKSGLLQSQVSFSPRVDWSSVTQQLKAEVEELRRQKAEVEARFSGLAEAKKQLSASRKELKAVLTLQS